MTKLADIKALLHGLDNVTKGERFTNMKQASLSDIRLLHEVSSSQMEYILHLEKRISALEKQMEGKA